MTLVFSRKVLAGGLVAALALGTLTAGTQEAEAGGYWRHRGYNGGAVAAGVIGGLALGALAATAARPAYAYPSYGYYPSSSYYGSGYYGGYARDYYAPVGVGGSYYGAYDPGPTCFWTRRRVAVDPYTVVVRRVRVCE